MIAHDLKEGFYLETRLWVFDKYRHDAQAPNAYGAMITYDFPVGKDDISNPEDLIHKDKIEQSITGVAQ